MKITKKYLNDLYFQEIGEVYEYQEFYEFTADLLNTFKWFYQYLPKNDSQYLYLSYVLMSKLKFYIFDCMRNNNLNEIDLIFRFLTDKLWITNNLDDMILITMGEELDIFDPDIISVFISFMTNELRDSFIQNYSSYLYD